ncbi:MAG TPA: hypothetical protein VIS72_13470 [Anaerolineales bacterium]
MQRIFIFSITILTLLLSSCATETPQTPPTVVTVYSSSSATPWLADVYSCAESIAIVQRVDDPASADIVLRVGEPAYLSTPAYQIDQEEILIVTHRQSPVQNLTLDEAQALFMGLGDLPVQLWIYDPAEDVFEVFDQFVMKGRSVSSSARVAVTPQQMSDVLNAESNAVGILLRRWRAGDVREVYSVAKVPVLAITQTGPQGVTSQLIGCLQK